MGQTFHQGWFVIYTKPRHEKKIAEQLDELQVCNFLPTIKTLMVWSDRRKYVDKPLFPSYLFIWLDNLQTYFRSLDINGVLYYLKDGKQIASVNETTINNLKMIVANTQDGIEVSFGHLAPGRKLTIKEGPFTGFTCEVIDWKGKQKILVRIELLQRNILVDMPVEYLMLPQSFSPIPG